MTLKKILAILLLCALSLSFAACSLFGADAAVEEKTPCDAETESKGADERSLAVVMYHNVLKSRKGVYIVSPEQLEADLIAFEKAGYTTVFPSEAVDFVYGGGELPQKPLIITFDDGRYNNMHYALPLLREHGCKAAFFPVGSFSAFSTDSGDHSNPNYSHLTWAQMGELQRSGAVEMGSHSYDMHRYSPRFGVKRMKGESDAEYRKALAEDTAKMQDALLRATGKLPCAYAYPFGEYSSEAAAVLRSFGLKMFFTCNEGVSVIRRGEPQTLNTVKRVNRAGNMTSDELTGLLAKYAR